MKEVDYVPDWVDWDSIDRTSEIIGPFIYALGQTNARFATYLGCYLTLSTWDCH